MFKPRLGGAVAALAVAAGLGILAPPQAIAGAVPMVNPKFLNGLTGWTPQVYNQGNDSFVLLGGYFNGLGVVQLFCEKQCPVGSSNSLSQVLTTLVTGHQYELTFYTDGWRQIVDTYSEPTPLEVRLGNSLDQFVHVPYVHYLNDPNPYELRTLDFTYTDNSPSATLTFAFNFDGLGCAPCYEQLNFSGITLDDVTPGPPPPPLPEPSTLALLGLGGMGLGLRRRIAKLLR